MINSLLAIWSILVFVCIFALWSRNNDNNASKKIICVYCDNGDGVSSYPRRGLRVKGIDNFKEDWNGSETGVYTNCEFCGSSNG